LVTALWAGRIVCVSTMAEGLYPIPVNTQLVTMAAVLRGLLSCLISEVSGLILGHYK